jgi:hypothetical protein
MLVSPHGNQPVSTDRPESRNQDGIMMLLGQALNGKVAAALMQKIKAGDMFAKTPEIHRLGVIADKPAK